MPIGPRKPEKGPSIKMARKREMTELTQKQIACPRLSCWMSCGVGWEAAGSAMGSTISSEEASVIVHARRRAFSQEAAPQIHEPIGATMMKMMKMTNTTVEKTSFKSALSSRVE